MFPEQLQCKDSETARLKLNGFLVDSEKKIHFSSIWEIGFLNVSDPPCVTGSAFVHFISAAFSPRNVVCRDYGYGRWRMTGTRFKRGKYLSSPSYPRMCCFFSTNGEQIRCHLTSSSAQESNVHHSATGVYYWAGRTLNAIACYVAGDANDFCHMEAQEKLLLMLLEDVKVGGGRKCRLARSVWFLLSEQKKKKAAACVLEH